MVGGRGYEHVTRGRLASRFHPSAPLSHPKSGGAPLCLSGGSSKSGHPALRPKRERSGTPGSSRSQLYRATESAGVPLPRWPARRHVTPGRRSILTRLVHIASAMCTAPLSVLNSTRLGRRTRGPVLSLGYRAILVSRPVRVTHPDQGARAPRVLARPAARAARPRRAVRPTPEQRQSTASAASR